MDQETNSDASTPATNNARQLGVIAGILLLAVAGLNFQWHIFNKPAATQTSSDDLIPDTIVQHPLLDTFDNTGKKIRQLRGEKLDYFDTDKRSIISSPQIHFEQLSDSKPPTPWLLSAETATMYQSSNQVDLRRNVQLSSDATPGGRTEFLTEQLLVDTARQFAETDKAVTIRARNSEAKSIGLRADLANERLLLPSRVKEIHEVHR